MSSTKERAALRRVNLVNWMDQHGLTQTDIAHQAGLSRSYVSLLFKPERFFGEKIAKSLETSLHMPSGYLDSNTREQKKQAVEAWSVPSDLREGVYALVPRVSVELSAGGGKVVDIEQELPPLAFRQDWLQSKCVTSKRNLRVLSVSGDSMEPYLQDNDVVLIDMGQNTIKDHEVYALRYGDELRIKRLSKRFDGGMLIKSDNQKYAEEVLTEQDAKQIHVLGRLLWRGG
jgi:phage repressor protein C with HTH and peptisase S24 domain